jgi:NitT/TauT family transport system substrate-binding protein
MRRAILGAVWLAAACGMAAITVAARAEPLKIRHQYASVSQFVPLMPLVPKDVYRHWGRSYVVEPIFMAGGGPALTALAAGEIDIGGFGPPAIANAVIEAKLEVRVIAQVLSIDVPGWNRNQFWAKRPVRSLVELKGKTIATNSRNSVSDAAVHIVLGRHGLKDGADYQMVEMRFPAILPALESGRVDVGMLIMPFSLRAQQMGMTPLFAIGDAFGPSETLVWAAKAEWIAKNRAVLVDFMEDHIRMRRWALDPATRMKAVELYARIEKQPVERYAPWVLTNRDTYRHPDALVDLARFQKNVDDLHKAGLAAGTIEAARYVDMSLAREALARLGTPGAGTKP